MWKLTRSDSITVWSKETVAKSLSRYRNIIDLKAQARYLLARKMQVEFDINDSLSNLWKKHERGQTEFKNELNTETTQINKSQDTDSKSFLDLKIELAHRILANCHFCEHRCNADRTTKLGNCGVNQSSHVSSAFLHTGEEAPLVPSGTIFFSGCNFRCAHCQNYDISCNPLNGKQITPIQLAKIADELASQGARNINYVGGDPTPHLHNILSSMKHQQFNITQLWNSNMYLSEESMELLRDIIDFWLPDFKYYSEECAKRISKIEKYTTVITRNIKTAYEKGSKEMIIRVLVLPNHLECCVLPILEWIAKNTPDALVNIMSQYRPLWQVHKKPEIYNDIQRRVTNEEMKRAYTYAEKLGIEFRSVS
ncbi:MAG: radical SAM protein [Candidatus Thorarchaeota archaeon]